MPYKDKEEQLKHNRKYYKRYYKKNREKLVKKSVEWRRQSKIKLRKEIVDMLGGKCSKCGYCRSIYALDFHHVSDIKKDNLSNLIGNVSREVVIAEAKKCVLLCANCHREEHFG